MAVTSDGISDANAGRNAAPTCQTYQNPCLKNYKKGRKGKKSNAFPLPELETVPI